MGDVANGNACMRTVRGLAAMNTVRWEIFENSCSCAACNSAVAKRLMMDARQKGRFSYG